MPQISGNEPILGLNRILSCERLLVTMGVRLGGGGVLRPPHAIN
jgi:hypothetical protein